MVDVELNIEDDTKLTEYRTRRVSEKISSKQTEREKINKQIEDLEE